MKQSAPGASARNNLFLSTGKKAILILLVGIFASAIVWFFLNNYYTSLLTRRASTFARVFEPAQIEHLRDASLADSDATYEEVRAKLADLEGIYEETRFVYLMARENGTITFLADSEPTDSPSYSARGDLYKDATEALKALFNKGEAFTEGPVSDEYGIWYSSLAPITNQKGEVVAIVGIDVPAVRYTALVAGISLLPLLARGCERYSCYHLRSIAPQSNYRLNV